MCRMRGAGESHLECDTMPLHKSLVGALLCAFAVSAVAETSGTLEKIRSTGTITLGYIEDAAPFSSVDAKGEPQGYSVDLCREIARGIGAQLGLPKIETRWVALTIQNRLRRCARGVSTSSAARRRGRYRASATWTSA